MFEITAVFMRYEKRALMMKSCWNKIMKGNKKKTKNKKQQHENVIITDHFMLNNINKYRLSKSKNVIVRNCSGATSHVI